MLRPSIDLPKVFEARDPKLIYGFVMLARVFKSIHSKFISAWMLPAPCENADDRDPTSTTLIDQEDLTNCLSVVEMDETQQLDVLITHQWLRALLCQLHIRRLRVTACTTEHITESHGAESISRNSIQLRILDACKNLLQIVSRANMWSLEAHGIGMVYTPQLHTLNYVISSRKLTYGNRRNKKYLTRPIACATFSPAFGEAAATTQVCHVHLICCIASWCSWVDFGIMKASTSGLWCKDPALYWHWS